MLLSRAASRLGQGCKFEEKAKDLESITVASSMAQGKLSGPALLAVHHPHSCL